MRMTNRLSKWSRHSQKMVCLLAACGFIYGCKDEYLLDDEKPSTLSSSLYESLQNPKVDGLGTFNTYLRLIGDEQVNTGDRSLTDVLSRTGSKTVFAANDEAWEAFFKKNAQLPEGNPWHNATCYENLSEAQKKLLIHTSMLNNAIVMENLASSQSSGNDAPTRGEYMRRYTDVETIDTITYVPSADIPVSYSPVDKDYWERFREENGGNGIWMVADSTVSMMLHFTSEHLTKNNVTDDDFAVFMGSPRVTSDVHIYDSKLISKDGVCENGYLNVTDKPLCPLASMAEVIRTNGLTNIFSHMLDRYSAPFYSRRITESYKDLHPEFEDSIFVKRYFSDNSAGHRALSSEPGPLGTYRQYMPYKDETSKDIVPSLKFDPGWNGYYDEVRVEKDMAAMFVPSDEALYKYFTEGGGLELIRTYYIKEGTTEQRTDYVVPAKGDYKALYEQIDYIPLGTLQSLINIIMMRSFVGSVPSKMTKLRDDAQEQLFYPEDLNKIDTCILASNGAIYIMDDIYGPADYTSVTSPAYISTTNSIMKWAIYDQTQMNLNYYAYLKAMQSTFTFFLPSDSALLNYYDPISMKSRTPRVISMTYKNQSFPIVPRCYSYSSPYNVKGDFSQVGNIGNALTGSVATINNSDVINRLKDILESHTIVQEDSAAIFGEDEYFVSKNGNAIKVVRDEDNNILEAKGGFQLENERNEVVSNNPGITECIVKKSYSKLKNGQTYVLNAPLIPTYRSVYSIFTDDMMEDASYNPKGYTDEAWEANPYRAFYELCMYSGTEDLVKGCGLVKRTLSNSEQYSQMKKFRIFYNDNSSKSDNSGGLDYNVQFFNNFRYTIFVPTNEAIEREIANGLPTWEEIAADYNSHVMPEMEDSLDEEGKPVVDEEGNNIQIPVVDSDGDTVYSDVLKTAADSLRIQAKITYLTNFLRNHFADNSVFADKSALSDEEMVTASYDKEKGLFCKIHVDRIKQGDETILRVQDENEYEKDVNNKYSVIYEKDGVNVKNILARDVTCSKAPRGIAMTGITLDASSTAVIHLIDGVLNHTALGADGRHNVVWETPAACKRYLKRYGLN